MSINGWSATEHTRVTGTAILRAWRNHSTPRYWRAEVLDLLGKQVALGSGFNTPGEAMDWADERWREIFP